MSEFDDLDGLPDTPANHARKAGEHLRGVQRAHEVLQEMDASGHTGYEIASKVGEFLTGPKTRVETHQFSVKPDQLSK